MTRFKLPRAAYFAGLHPLADGRWLATAAYGPRTAAHLVWVDPAAGEVGRDRFLTSGAVVSADGTRLARVYNLSEIGPRVFVGPATDPADEPVQVPVPPRPTAPFEFAELAGFDRAGRPLAVYSRPATAHAAYREVLVRVPAGGRSAGVVLGRWTARASVAAVAPDGRTAAVGERYPPAGVRGLALPAGRERWRFLPPAGGVAAVRFAPDGSRLAVLAGRRGFLLAPDTGAVAAGVGAPSKQLTAVAFTPDGRRLLTAGNDGCVRLWDAAGGGLLVEWDFRVGPVTAVAVAVDGLTAAAGGSQGRLVVWDLDA